MRVIVSLVGHGAYIMGLGLGLDRELGRNLGKDLCCYISWDLDLDQDLGQDTGQDSGRYKGQYSDCCGWRVNKLLCAFRANSHDNNLPAYKSFLIFIL